MVISAQRGRSVPDSEAWLQHTFDISFDPPNMWQCQPRFMGRIQSTHPWKELKVTLQWAGMQEGLTNVSAINLALNLVSLLTSYFISKIL